jgi:PAS domain S-box-containing protein
MTNNKLLSTSLDLIDNEFFNTLPVAVVIWKNDANYTIEAISKNISKILGFSQKDFISKKTIYTDLIHPDDLNTVLDVVKNNLSEKKLEFTPAPYRIINSEGVYKWIKIHITLIYEKSCVSHFIGYISDYTLEKELILENEKVKQRFENMFYNHNAIMILINPDTAKIINVNKKAIEFYGYSYEEFIKLKISDLNQLSNKEIVKITDCARSNRSNKFQLFHKLKNAEVKKVQIHSSPIETDDGIILFSIIEDISEACKIKEDLEKNLIYNKTLIDNLPMLVWLKDKNSNFLAVNQSYANSTILKKTNLIAGKNNFDIWSNKKVAQKHIYDDKTVLKNGKAMLFMEEILNKDEKKYFEIFKSPVYDNKNELLGTIGYAIDITNKLVTEEKMKSQYEQLELEKIKLSTIIHSLPDLLWIKDKDGKYLACNKRFEDFFGAKESDIVGKYDQDFVNKEITEFFRKHDLEAMQSDVPLSNYEDLTFASDGHKEYTHTIKTKVILNDGTIFGILGIGRDISKIKMYQDKIEEQKEEFETIFNSSKDGIAILDLESNFLNCNESYCEMIEYNKEELLTKSCIELTIPEDREQSIKIMNKIIEKGFIVNFEKRCLTKNQRRIYVNMAASLLPDKKRILLVTKNVSDIKLLEEQSKLISMGEMIGNIAHQWRQPLSVISTISTGVLLQKELGLLSDEVFIDNMKNINDSAQYLSKTIDDFRNFIKNEEIIELISIKDALDYTIHLTEASLKNNYINLIVNCEEDISIHAIKNELVQSFMNIINNAKDALITTTKEENRYIFIKSKKIKDTLELSISDSAGGIANDIIDRIFEPYFTTKHQTRGTGVGLSIVNKILYDKYHTEISVFNNSVIHNNIPYYGACFKMVFKEEGT